MSHTDLTVLIPTSPIPSHPSTAILDETISNIREYTDAKILILADGVHPYHIDKTGEYMEYLQLIDVKRRRGDYGECDRIVFPDHTHQAEMTRFALTQIDTPLIFFCEHDTSPIGEIPFFHMKHLIRVHTGINYIRFNIFDRIPKEHEYLMIGKPREWGYNMRLQHTIQWSQRPHLAKTDWYRNIIKDHFEKGEKTMIEDRMHSVVIESYKRLKGDIFGLYIFTPEGNQLRSYHADGRKHDQKIIEA